MEQEQFSKNLCWCQNKCLPKVAQYLAKKKNQFWSSVKDCTLPNFGGGRHFYDAALKWLQIFHSFSTYYPDIYIYSFSRYCIAFPHFIHIFYSLSTYYPDISKFSRYYSNISWYFIALTYYPDDLKENLGKSFAYNLSIWLTICQKDYHS